MNCDSDDMSMADLALRALGKFTRAVRTSSSHTVSAMHNNVPNVIPVDSESEPVSAPKYDITRADIEKSDSRPEGTTKVSSVVCGDTAGDAREETPPSQEGSSLMRSLGDEAKGYPEVMLQHHIDNGADLQPISGARLSHLSNTLSSGRVLNRPGISPFVHDPVESTITLEARDYIAERAARSDAGSTFPRQPRAAAIQPPSFSDRRSSFVVGLTRLLVGPSWLENVFDMPSGAIETARSSAKQLSTDVPQSHSRRIGRPQAIHEEIHQREIAEIDAKHIAMKKELMCQSLQAALSLPMLLRKVPRDKVAKAFASDITETRRNHMVIHMRQSGCKETRDSNRTALQLVEVTSRLEAVKCMAAVGSVAAAKLVLQHRKQQEFDVACLPLPSSKGETERYSNRIESLEEDLRRARCQVSASANIALERACASGQIIPRSGARKAAIGNSLKTNTAGDQITMLQPELNKLGGKNPVARVRLDGANATSKWLCGEVRDAPRLQKDLSSPHCGYGSLHRVSKLAVFSNLKKISQLAADGDAVESDRVDECCAVYSHELPDAFSEEENTRNLQINNTWPADCSNCDSEKVLGAALCEGTSTDSQVIHGDAICALHASFAAARAAHASEIGGLKSALAAARASSATTNRDTSFSNLETERNPTEDRDMMVEALRLELKALTSAHGREIQRLKTSLQADVSAGATRKMSDDESKTMIEMLRNQLEAAGLKPIDKVSGDQSHLLDSKVGHFL